jgi:hypothetical protein
MEVNKLYIVKTIYIQNYILPTIKKRMAIAKICNFILKCVKTYFTIVSYDTYINDDNETYEIINTTFYSIKYDNSIWMIENVINKFHNINNINNINNLNNLKFNNIQTNKNLTIQKFIKKMYLKNIINIYKHQCNVNNIIEVLDEETNTNIPILKKDYEFYFNINFNQIIQLLIHKYVHEYNDNIIQLQNININEDLHVVDIDMLYSEILNEYYEPTIIASEYMGYTEDFIEACTNKFHSILKIK